MTFYSIALESAQELLAKDNPNVANALQNIAVFLKNINALDQAEEFQAKSLEIRVKGTHEYANSLANLAAIKERRGLVAEAISMYAQALEDLRRIRGRRADRSTSE